MEKKYQDDWENVLDPCFHPRGPRLRFYLLHVFENSISQILNHHPAIVRPKRAQLHISWTTLFPHLTHPIQETSALLSLVLLAQVFQ